MATRRLLAVFGAVASVAFSPSLAPSVSAHNVRLRALEEEDEECMVIRFVTGNAKKLREVMTILEDEDLPLPLEQCSLDLDELQSESPEKIAAAKCALAAEVVGGPVLVDDTSLCLNSLGGVPGPYIKWFCGKDKPPDILARMLDGFDDKSAYAVSCMAFVTGPKAVPLVFKGRVDGVIVEPSQGTHGFGWDNSFQPDGSDITFAEMSLEEKNKISHRAQALKQLSAYLHQHKDLLFQLCGEHQSSPNTSQNNPDKFRFHRRRAAL